VDEPDLARVPRAAEARPTYEFVLQTERRQDLIAAHFGDARVAVA
jgi:hypothetical protein